MFLLGCGALLGVPDDPRLIAPIGEPRDVPLDRGPLDATPVSIEEDAAPPIVTSGPESRAEPGVAALEPALVDADGALDGGSVSVLAPGAVASSPVDAAPGTDPPTPGDPGTPGSVGVVLFCPALVRDLISDFSLVAGANPAEMSFGPEASFRGGTYFYPRGAGLTSDVSGDDWNVSGTVTGPSGFGLYMSTCSLLDASAFTGIAFRIWGQIAETSSLVLVIETAAHQVSHVWLNDHKATPTDPDVPPNAGRCIPAARRFDGTCRGARITIPVTQTPTDLTISWLDLDGSSPVGIVDPSEITSIVWEFSQPAVDGYPVDIHLDDLRFAVP